VLAAASARAARGQDVIHLEVGEPGGGPPPPVLEAARQALGRIPLGYTEALGRPALRRAIARHYRTAYDIEVDPGQVAVTVGASGAFVLTFLAAFDPGDRVVVPEPAFPAYKNILRALGIEVIRLGLGPETGFALTVEQLAGVEPPVHGLVIASPANPPGTMLRSGQLEDLARHCRARGIWLISDEIYHGITYEHPATSMLAYDPDAVVINGFSKYFGMTGWRLGWLVALAPGVDFDGVAGRRSVRLAFAGTTKGGRGRRPHRGVAARPSLNLALDGRGRYSSLCTNRLHQPRRGVAGRS
jgi:aspartate/methionine/tyrosine aminotransferase